MSPMRDGQESFYTGFTNRVSSMRSAKAVAVMGEHLEATAAYVIDQSVCIVGNFFVSFLAVRHLSLDEFGVFALLNLIVIFSLTVNNWLIRSSLSEASQLGDPREVRTYTSTLAWLSGGFGLLVGAVLIGAACALQHRDLWPCLLVVAVGAQVQELLRRSAMAQLKFRVGIIGDVVSYLGQALVLLVIVGYGKVTLQVIFWSIGITSVVSGMIQASCLSLRSPSRLMATAQRCWANGRWVTLSGVMLSPLMYGMPWIVEVTRGKTEVGKLSSLLLVLGLCNPIMFSSTWLILVRAQVAKNKPLAGLLRQVFPTFFLTILPLSTIWIVLLLFPRECLRLFYGPRSAYAHLGGDLQLVVCCFVASYVAACLEVLTDTKDRTRERVRMDIGASVITVSAGLLLSYEYGVTGILCVCLCAHVFRAVAYWIILLRATPNLSAVPVSASAVQEVPS